MFILVPFFPSFSSIARILRSNHQVTDGASFCETEKGSGRDLSTTVGVDFFSMEGQRPCKSHIGFETCSPLWARDLRKLWMICPSYCTGSFPFDDKKRSLQQCTAMPILHKLKLTFSRNKPLYNDF